MRFETLGYKDKQRNLKRMYNRLNKHLFDGALKDIPLSFANLDNPSDNSTGSAAWARFRRDDIYYQYDKKTGQAFQVVGASIKFDNDFEDALEEMKTQREQILALGKVMLHEMIHQYCYENGIDDTDHGGRWSEVAEKHGLHSVYKDGECIEEWGMMVLRLTLSGFRFTA